MIRIFRLNKSSNIEGNQCQDYNKGGAIHFIPKKLMSRAIEIIYAGPNQHNGEFMAWYPPIAVGNFYVCVHLVLYMLLYIILFLKRWMAKIVVEDSLRHYIL